MYFTPWTDEEGYYESLGSLRKGTSPIIRARAVKNGKNKYDAVVRDFGGKGVMLGSKINLTLEDAKLSSRALAVTIILIETLSNITSDI